jgi:ribosomal protein S18 acetylase RimI-like enzyme
MQVKPSSITPAALEDAPAILELQRQAYQSEALLYDNWTIPPLTQILAELRQEFRAGLVLKAVSDGSLVGSIRAHATDGIVQVGRPMVAPTVQRHGFGSAMLRAIETGFPTAKRLDLFTGSKSEGNIRLYTRHGYVFTHEKVLSPGTILAFMSKSNEIAF